MARAGAELDALEAEVARILAVLTRTGAVRVAPEALQPADVLLDLYGEDIRARAFTTRDDAGERMLRPDFTVPIVRLHMAGAPRARALCLCRPGLAPAGAGSPGRAEYLQAGVELFDGTDPAEADAEVFALVAEAVRGGAGGEPRRDRHRRHGPRPRRDRRAAHLGRAQARAAPARLAPRRLPPPARPLRPAPRRDRGLPGPSLSPVREGRAAAISRPAPRRPALACRDRGRLARLAEEAATPPLAPARGRDARGRARGPRQRRRGARPLPRPRPLRAGPRAGRRAPRRPPRRPGRAGHPPETLPFEASFGRTTLEYYDGFVFGFRAPDRPDLPPLASGGRYDALTRILGDRPVPAVGGMVRPEALLALGGGR
jgi:ATP phosphoribosyltransferase regulatory subunit